MNDDDFVAALRAFFDADDPYDGIDRSDGYNDDYRFGPIAVVRGDDGFDDLQVLVEDDGTIRVARLLFDRAWRETSGLDEVGAYAAYVVARWRSSVLDDRVGAGPGSPGSRSGGVGGLEARLLDTYGNVNEIASGVVEVIDESGDLFFVHVTEQQWRGLDHAAGSTAFDDLEQLIDSRWDDEDHIVFFRGSFHRSVRAELPPVRSRLLF